MPVHAFRLEEAGFTRSQVEALSDFMDTQAASKADLEAVAHRLETKIAEVQVGIAEVKSALHGEITEVHSATKADLESLAHRLGT
ncbi:hypothetical protein, partial [Pararhodospirillum oryzae]|uniref:hypothetical protein n=1 Tax=Pararhodospirillum oryzae TaxID=478448 RepID=UPI0011BE3567